MRARPRVRAVKNILGKKVMNNSGIVEAGGNSPARFGFLNLMNRRVFSRWNFRLYTILDLTGTTCEKYNFRLSGNRGQTSAY
jgi:hypothetical protein